MSKFKYQNQVDTIIKWYKQGKTFVEIAQLLQSEDVRNDAQNIRRLLIYELGPISSNRKVVITKELENQIQSLLEKGMNQKQISDILHIKYPTLGSYFQKRKISFLPNPGNVHYFEKIDTYAKAYILGFIAADGALVPAKKGPTITLTITIKYEDKAILEFIKSEIGNTHKLQEIVRPSGFDKSKIIHHIRLTMSNPQIVKDIMKYGITFNKSLTMGNIIENVPVRFRDAFIIGYFDGDGSVHIETKPRKNSRSILCKDNSLYINIRGTRPFLEGICNHLNIDTSHIYQHDSIPNLAFANKKDTYRFYQCYQHLPFYYKRKHDRFLAKINHPSYDKYKQGQTISSPTT
jgi:DNA-binding CsgD family transcriptional regulator